MRRDRRGFTLIEFLVAIGIIAILIAILIPYLLQNREMNRRIECQAHLGQIGAALLQYGRVSGAGFPLPQTPYDAAHFPQGYTAFTGADERDSSGKESAVKPNDITASLWLLVRGGFVKDPGTFICPSTSDRPDTLTDAMGNAVSALKRGNFRAPENLSYSYASPFTDSFKVDFSSDRLHAEYAVLADKNPGFQTDGDRVMGPARDASPFELATGNSPNHQQAGQNVLHPAGDVSFETTPYCGVAHDNIYTAEAPHGHPASRPSAADEPGFVGKDVGPAYSYDSYLVPTARDAFGN